VNGREEPKTADELKPDEVHVLKRTQLCAAAIFVRTCRGWWQSQPGALTSNFLVPIYFLSLSEASRR
jgi:hypothetical protein